MAVKKRCDRMTTKDQLLKAATTGAKLGIQYMQGRPKYRLKNRRGVYKSKYRRRRKRLSVAAKALRNVGFQRAYYQTGNRITTGNGLQAFKLLSTGLVDQRLYDMFKAANPSFDPSINNYLAFLKNTAKDIYITNASNNQTVVYVYEMICKRESVNNVLEDAEAGDDKLAGSDVTPLTHTNPGYSPLGAPLVYTNWKKWKTFKRIMDPGAVWHIRISVPLNRYYNTANLISDNGTNSNKSLRGLSAQTLIRVHGTPASLTAAEGTVVLSPCRVEYTCAEYYTYKMTDKMVNQTELLQGYSTTAGTVDIIQDETGGQDTVKFA